jgi:DNA mismatch endonuclease (patch repair protein)
MSRVRQRDTAPELLVRRLLHARGWRYRLQDRKLPGTPDLVFPRLRKAVFVHGCFWHGHDCKAGKLPSSRSEYWTPKIAANRDRDRRTIEKLNELGWQAIVVWQCETKDRETLLHKVESFLHPAASGAARSA